MKTIIQVRQRGKVTLPVELRNKYNLQEGDKLDLLDLDGVFVITPMIPVVPELTQEIERLRLEAGMSTDELLADLRQQREQN
jgi:AbrB family looped-hinge helix DNA binding protein